MAFADEIVKLQRQRSVYLDFSVVNNPGVDWEGEVTRLYGVAYDNMGEVPIQGTVTSFGTFARSVMNAELSLETPSVTVTLVDPFHDWRRLAEPPSDKLMYRWVHLMMRVLDDNGGYFDHRVAVGQIVEPRFGAGKQVSLNIQLSPGSFMGEDLPRRLITLRDFPRAAPEEVGKVVPIIYGVMSNSVRSAVIEEEVPATVGDGTVSSGAVEFDSKTSSNVGNDFYVMEVRAYGTPGYWFLSLYRNDDTATNQLEVYSRNDPSFLMATVPNFWDESAFHRIRVEWILSTSTGAPLYNFNSDGTVRVYRDGVLMVDLTNIIVSPDSDPPFNTWDIIVLTPQGELDNLEIYGGGGLIFSDDFNGPNTLAADGYTGVSASKVAGVGVGGTQGVQGGEFDEFTRTVTPNEATGTGGGSGGTAQTLWTDDFESLTALANDYTGFTSGTAPNGVKTDGAGNNGSRGLVITGGGAVRHPTTFSCNQGVVQVDCYIPTTADAAWVFSQDEAIGEGIELAMYFDGGVPHITLTWANLAQLGDDSGDSLTGTWFSPGTWFTARLEWTWSTFLGVGPYHDAFATDGTIRLLIDGEVVIDKTGLRVLSSFSTADHQSQTNAIILSPANLDDATYDNLLIIDPCGEGVGVVTTVPATCTPTDTGTGPNMASGAVRALLVDTGLTTTVSVQNPAPTPGTATIDTSIEQMGAGAANERTGSGSINVPTFFLIAPLMADGRLGPLSPIMDLDQSYAADYPAHNAVISWNDITVTPDQWIVWMFTDFNFHPVSNPEPGARTRIIPGTPYTTPDWPPGNTYDYQVVFSSVDDGDPWEPVAPLPGVTTSTAFSGYRYVLAAHTLHRVNEVYVRRPVAVPGDATSNPDPDPVTVDMQVLQQEGTDYVQEIIEINGNRYHTLRFFAAMQSDDCTTQYEVTANVEGVETNADGTGTLITNGIEMVEHILLNWVFNNYRSSVGIYAPPGGRWFTDVPYAPGLLDHSSFLAATERAYSFVTDGYQGSGVLIEQQSGVSLVTDLMNTFGLDFYFDSTSISSPGNGAWAVKLFYPADLVPSALTSLRPDPSPGDVGINAGSFEVWLDRNAQRNAIPYFAGPMTGRAADSSTNEDGGYTVSGEVRDASSIQRYGLIVNEPVYLPWTRDPETAYSVIYRMLLLLRYPPLYARVQTPLSSILLPPSSEVRVTHPDGTGISGWTDRVCRIYRADIDLTNMTMDLTLRDVHALVGLSMGQIDGGGIPANPVSEPPVVASGGGPAGGGGVVGGGSGGGGTVAVNAVWTIPVDAGSYPLGGADNVSTPTANYTRSLIVGGGPSGQNAVRISHVGTADTSLEYYHGKWDWTGPNVPQGQCVVIREIIRFNAPVNWEDNGGGRFGFKHIVIGEDGTNDVNRGFVNFRSDLSVPAEAHEPTQILMRVERNIFGPPSRCDVHDMTSGVWYRIQIEYQSSSTPTAADGFIRVWVNNQVYASPTVQSTGGFAWPTVGWSRISLGFYGESLGIGRNASYDIAGFDVEVGATPGAAFDPTF